MLFPLGGAQMENNKQTAPTDREFQALLTEYKAAQDSAQHHDSFEWPMAQTIWVGSLIALGLILERSCLTQSTYRPLFVFVSFLGLCLNLFVPFAYQVLRVVKIQKYERCKEIERRLGFLEQHRTLRYPKKLGYSQFLTFISSLFIALWILVLMSTLGVEIPYTLISVPVIGALVILIFAAIWLLARHLQRRYVGNDTSLKKGEGG
jgi:hypothetical protein